MSEINDILDLDKELLYLHNCFLLWKVYWLVFLRISFFLSVLYISIFILVPKWCSIFHFYRDFLFDSSFRSYIFLSVQRGKKEKQEMILLKKIIWCLNMFVLIWVCILQHRLSLILWTWCQLIEPCYWIFYNIHP